MLIKEEERILIAKVLNFKLSANKRNNPQLLKLSFYSSELKSNVHIAKILKSIKDNTSIVENPEEIDSKTIRRYWNTLKNLALVTGTVDNPKLTAVADYYINAYNKEYENEGERNKFFQSENIIAIEYEVVKNLIKLVSTEETHENYNVFLEIWYNIQLFFSYLPTNDIDNILGDINLLYFLYRINANGWEIARYFQLSPEEQVDFRGIFDKYTIDTTEEKLINKITKTEELFSQINCMEEKILVKYLEATINTQADIRYRIYALLNAFYKLKKEGNLPLIDSQYRIYNNNNTNSNYTKIVRLNDDTTLSNIKLPYQLIIQGCPGSGKSFYAHSIATQYGDKIIRTQFHPETSYFDFIGSYKPVPVYETSDNIIVDIESKPFKLGRPLIDYQYKAGFMLQALLHAYRHTDEVTILLIEEINRGEVSSIFGDFFQLLDRQEDGCSRFPIASTDEQKGFFLNHGLDNVDKLYLPPNLFIIATMNSADQGVFPLDTAFKRRWSFMYKGYLEQCKYAPENQKLLYGNEKVNWDIFRKKVNDVLLNNDIHEDRLIGAYFLNEKELSNPKEVLEKLLMYLWDDVLRFKQEILFNVKSFSALIEAWDNGKGAPLKIELSVGENNENNTDIQNLDEFDFDNVSTDETIDLLESTEE